DGAAWPQCKRNLAFAVASAWEGDSVEAMTAVGPLADAPLHCTRARLLPLAGRCLQKPAGAIGGWLTSGQAVVGLVCVGCFVLDACSVACGRSVERVGAPVGVRGVLARPDCQHDAWTA